MVVRFVRVIRVPACARVSRVSRVCPGSPRCLFTGTSCNTFCTGTSTVHVHDQGTYSTVRYSTSCHTFCTGTSLYKFVDKSPTVSITEKPNRLHKASCRHCSISGRTLTIVTSRSHHCRSRSGTHMQAQVPRPGGLEVGSLLQWSGWSVPAALSVFAGLGWISIEEKGIFNTRLKISDHCPLSLRTIMYMLYHVVSCCITMLYH